MAKQDERRALLEDFAVACTVAAQERTQHKLDWEPGKDGFIYFHCPLPGDREPHNWNGAPRASAWISPGGNIHCVCSKCVGAKNDYPDQAGYEAAREDYTERVKRAIRWEQDGVIRAGFKTEIIRSHLYVDRDLKNACRRDKVRYEDGRKEKSNWDPWRWSFAPMANGRPGKFMRQKVDEWLPCHYPEVGKIYEALRWYSFDRFINTTPDDCKVVIAEGEKDCDSFNALMGAAGERGYSATCLAHPGPVKLASHHIELIAGRDVIIVGDADEAGRQHAENMVGLVWAHARSVKLVREQLGLKGTSDDKDLTDWIVKRGGLKYPGLTGKTADELLDLFAATPPLLEPIARPNAWRQDMTLTREGKPSSTSPLNAEKVWTQHPSLKGRVRTNMHTGEVEIIGPPWCPDKVEVGARAAALGCAVWLESAEKMPLSPRVLEDMLRKETVSPVTNAVEQPGEWDGTPAVGRMLADVPLDVPAPQALRLWEILFSDLEAKLAGELHAQRYVLGVVTEKNINLARALAGKHGAVHAGVVTEAHLLDFARRNLLVVQVEMRTVADERRSLRSMQNLMQPDVWSRAVGRSLPTPLFIAVGPWSGDKRVLERTSEGCLPLRLKGGVLEDALAGDSQAALAEARARRGEFLALKAPTREQLLTVDEAHRIEAVSAMLWAIYHYATKALPLDRPLDPSHVRTAGLRAEPLRYVAREQFLDVMRPTLFGTWRGDDQMGHAFNAACRIMGWRNKLSITPQIVAQIGLSLDFQGRTSASLPGCLLDPEKIRVLWNKLSSEDDPLDDLPPTGGGLTPDLAPEVAPPCATVAPPDKTRVSAGCAVAPEAITREGERSKVVHTPRARGRAIESQDKRKTRLAGPEAVEAVRAILSEPGICSLDFETYPTDPAWHGEQAALNAPRGRKGDAKDRAILAARMGVRAHQRQACTLQLRHSDGAEVFVRLTDPARELPAMFEPVTSAAPWDDPPVLVAYNAQFETEVLLKHGVAVDVECTMIAAKCLYLEAVGEDRPQPVGFGLADLVAMEFGRKRDKAVRDRDWRLEESLDDEAVEYGLQDARDALELWQRYERRLRDGGLFDGYRMMQGALLPTAECNLNGLPLDAAAHGVLMRKLEREAADLGRELDSLCDRRIANHGSSAQVSTWIMEEVLGEPIKRPEAPKILGLIEFLKSRGGLRPDPGGELVARDVPTSLIRLDGMTLEDATIAAWEHGYIGLEHDRFRADAGRPGEDDLLAAIDDELAGRRVLPLDQREAWDAYLAESEHWSQNHRDDNLMSRFVMRLRARCGVGWRTTKTGHLAVTKSSKLRKAEQLKDAFPRVAAYLVKHAQWNRASKLLDSFGPTLRRWVDDDGYVRGQARVFGAWTGRQSCADPNLQNQPREEEFRALWRAS